MNSFGTLFRLTTFGESHGAAMGGVVDGMPAGVSISIEDIQRELDRRRPGQSAITSQRNEADRVEILSGIFEGKTTGQPIGFIVRNTDHKSDDYDALRHVFRPSHADYTYAVKYGHRDHRGGGRSSAREHVSRVVGGALARQFLATKGIKIEAFTVQVGDIALAGDFTRYAFLQNEENAVRCPDAEVADRMEQLIRVVKASGDTIGGVVGCVVRGCPVGLGEPVFGKLQAMLAQAMLSINAAKGFDYGAGFAGVSERGSEQNDRFVLSPDGAICTATNHSGGIQGGISNAQDIYFRVAFKPVATLLMPQPTVTDDFKPTMVNPRGRHDPCVVPRAVPVVEAMAAMVIMDAWLMMTCR